MRRILAVVPFLTLFSCATILTDRLETIEVNSSPAGADAVITCVNGTTVRGVTPVTMRIRRNSGECQLKVTRQGFRENRTTLAAGMNGAFWGNFGFIPLAPLGAYAAAIGNTDGDSEAVTVGTAMMATAIGVFLIDYGTGSMREHDPNKIDAVLTPNE